MYWFFDLVFGGIVCSFVKEIIVAFFKIILIIDLCARVFILRYGIVSVIQAKDEINVPIALCYW